MIFEMTGLLKLDINGFENMTISLLTRCRELIFSMKILIPVETCWLLCSLVSLAYSRTGEFILKP